MGCRKNDPECKSTTTATSKPKFFVTVVNAVNYCHWEIHYRCCRGPRYASETSYYKEEQR